ncbi:MAG TPA: hypothetical protein VFW17_11715 [Ktedonobacterales bacterium]|nr:hypothetical protein [Ktedonobacterales bacterium]
MKSSNSSSWEHVVTVVRWFARILAIVAGVSFAALAFSGAINYGVANWLPWVLYGLLGVGLLVLIFWKGIGEVVGGLVLVGIAAWLFVAGRFDLNGLVLFGPLALGGVLFIACGWYALAQRSRRATQVMA